MDDLRYYKKEQDLTPGKRTSLKRYIENENMSVDHLRKVSGVRLDAIIEVLSAALCGKSNISPTHVSY